ncbi:hypothetical protein F3Y22_tig00110903pilonHSYRG00056 [Hibiscus syriacus]|uniref:RNase H type-1 domain-containing protein n=1 Tax=Hibiscus syriacus TaxID=106335 RepID=A0A6A2ZFD9_HIBSY|nr:hypothetical protein F3Y22_tig00110903pilonHSYRG00056 [Hibiscus syriacus]
MQDLGKYLGVPILHGRVTSGSYQYLICMVQSRLSGWAMKSLSMTGRITLVKKSGVHLVKWEDMCRPIHQGGLGFRQLSRQNDAFMMKVAFNVLANKDQLWLTDCGPLIDHVTVTGTIRLSNVMVDDVEVWKWALIEPYLPDNILLRITAIKGPLPSFGSDIVGWNLRKDRRFSVGSKYTSREEHAQIEGNNELVWGLINKRMRRHFAIDSRCSLFHDPIEDISHVLRTYPKALAVLAAVIKPWKLHEYIATNLRPWRLLVWETESSRKWLRPSVGWMKVNFDGAHHRESGRSTCGCVIWNHEGIWQMGFSKFIGICSVVEAKLWGVYIGLLCSSGMGCRLVIVEIDSLETLKMIHGVDQGFKSRLGNQVADDMAKLSQRDTYECITFEAAPGEVTTMV